MRRELRIEARRLRQDGWSVRDIEKHLGVARSSVSLWVRDITLSETQVEQLQERRKQYGAQNKGANVNREKARALRRHYQEVGRAKACEGGLLHHAGCMLYWAEGAKDRNRVAFVNSDANMLRLFMRFLREELCVADESIRLRIHCHNSDPVAIRGIEQYWLSTLRLPQTSLGKTYVKKGSTVVHHTLEHGVCGIWVLSTELAQHIFGAIQEYGGFDNPAWLA